MDKPNESRNKKNWLHPPKITRWWFFTKPFENYDRQNGFIFPCFRGEHKEYLKALPKINIEPENDGLVQMFLLESKGARILRFRPLIFLGCTFYWILAV